MSRGLLNLMGERWWAPGLLLAALLLGALAGAWAGERAALGVLGASALLGLALMCARERHLLTRLSAGPEAMAALDIALLILDAEDRLRWCSPAFVRLYPGLEGRLRRGMRYADMARLAVQSGAIDPGPAGLDAWLAERLARHARTGPEGDSWQQQMQDGRVLQVLERRTSSGGWASLRFEVTELVQAQEALRRARDDANASNEMLTEALEAMPAGFEIWGPDDRLLRANERVRQQYPPTAHLLQPGVSFEAVVRASLASGAIASARGREAEWLGERLAQRGRLGRPFLQDYQGRWISVEERRMPSGRLVTVRQEVTELVEARNALTQARQLAEQRHHLLAHALDALPMGLEIFDPEDRYLYVNRTFRDWHPQVDYNQLIGQTFEEAVRLSQRLGLLPLEARADPEAWIAERVASHGRRTEPMLQHRPDGMVLLTQEIRTPEGFVVTLRQDVTQQLARERALETSQAQVLAIVQTAGAAILTLDPQGRLRSLNPAAESLWGYPAQEMVGQPLDRLLQAEANSELAGLMREHLRGQGSALLGPRRELRARHRDGHAIHIQAAISEVRTAGDHFFVAVVTDISAAKHLEAELRLANERLEQLSRTDALTELANRRRLMEALQELWQHSLRERKPFALLMVDVDHFKRYNDHHGHRAGDAALRQVAEVLRAAARRSTDVVARYGGEEFVLLLDDCDAEGALRRAEDVRAALQARALPHGAAPLGRVSLSIGVHAQVPELGRSAEEWLSRADAALYRAKAGGRDRVELSITDPTP